MSPQEEQAAQSKPAEADQAEAVSSGAGAPSSQAYGVDQLSPLMTEPPGRRDRRSHQWLLLAVCLVLALPGMLVDLQGPGVVDRREAQTLEVSTQSWRRYQGLIREEKMAISHVVPHLHGKPQLKQPPGVTWLHMAVFGLSAKHSDSAQNFVLRARLVSVAVGLLTLASIYWAGVSIGGMFTGLFAALICLANPIFVYHARLATPAIHQGGWVSLSIAAALWAIRPLKPSPALARQAIGWCTAGVALGIGILTSGSIALPMVGIPILIILAMCPHRLNHTMGLLAVLLIGLQITLPWVAYVHGYESNIWEHWLLNLLPNAASVWRDIGATASFVFGALLPWTLWLIGAVALLFGRVTPDLRRRVWFGWIWFVGVGVVSLVRIGKDDQSDWLAILGPFAVLIGLLFSYYSGLAAEGRQAWSWRVLCWPNQVLLGIASITLPVFLYAQPMLVARDMMSQPFTVPISMLMAVGMSFILLLIWGLSLRWVIKQCPDWVLVGWVAWMLAMIWMVILPITHGPMMRH